MSSVFPKKGEIFSASRPPFDSRLFSPFFSPFRACLLFVVCFRSSTDLLPALGFRLVLSLLALPPLCACPFLLCVFALPPAFSPALPLPDLSLRPHPPLRLLRSAGLPFARVFPISLSLSSRTVPAARIRPRAFLCPFPTCGQEKTRTDRLSGPFSLYENSLGKSLFSRKNLFRMAVFRPLSVCRRDSSHSVPNTPARSRSPTGPTASGG